MALALLDGRSMDDRLEGLVEGAAAGDEQAWHDLWCAVAPRLTGLLRRRSLRSHDEVRDMVVAVMARLRAERFRRLHLYLQARGGDPDLTFMRWLAVVARRVMVDCLRASPRPIDALLLVEPWRETMTARLAAGQIMGYASGALCERQRRALELWSAQGRSSEIARTLGLRDAADAERLVRAGLERLRRHFRRPARARAGS